MSDIRKILNTLTEMTSGSVASVSMPLTTQRRQDHVDENDAKSNTPEVLEYGNWENSSLTTSKKLKQTRGKAKKLVKKIYGEDTTTESMDGVAPSTKMFTSEGKTKNPVARAAQRVAKGSGKHKNPAKVLPRKAKHKKMYEEEITEQDLIISPVIRRVKDRDLISRDHSRVDHEVEMARGDLHQSQQNAAKILKMIQNTSEQEGLEGWVQEKIIKASDYLNTVREYLENKGQQGVAEGIVDTVKQGVNKLTGFKVRASPDDVVWIDFRRVYTREEERKIITNLKIKLEKQGIQVTGPRETNKEYFRGAADAVRGLAGKYYIPNFYLYLPNRETETMLNMLQNNKIPGYTVAIPFTRSDGSKPRADQNVEYGEAENGFSHPSDYGRYTRRANPAGGDPRESLESNKKILENTEHLVKDLISGWDDNYYPNPARPEWKLQGVKTLSSVFNGGAIPAQIVEGGKRGFWIIERDDDYPRGVWNTVTVTDPKYFGLFLDIVYKDNSNTNVFVNSKQGVTEGSEQNLSVQQLATISDEALDKAYGYGRSSPGNTFGWQANLMSAAYAKKMIDAGVTDIEQISDAIHKGWNVTAQKFVQNPDQFDDTEKLRQAGKLEAKLQQRAKLMKINYAQLDNEEQEKDRVVARALLQAIKGQQGVAEGSLEEVNTRTLVNYVPKAGRTLASLSPDKRKKRSGMMTRAYQKLIPRPDFSDEIKKYQDEKNKKGVAEGYSLKKTNVDKYMEPGDPDEYTQDINIKDTDYEIINNKTGQVVGTASWTTNDFMGPGALKITMKNGATRYLDIWASEKGNPQTAFNRFVKDPKTAKKYKEQGVSEGIPQPGDSSGKAKQFNPNAKIQTREMTLDQILSSVKGIPYVNDVIQDWDAKDYSWGVTKKVIEYAQYLQKNPQSVANLPPLVVIDGQLNDGAHRLSAINLLQKRMDSKNPLWKQVKLKVNFGTSADVMSEQGVAEDLDANQRRVGQLGPTEKIGKRGTRGRLVGGN